MARRSIQPLSLPSFHLSIPARPFRKAVSWRPPTPLWESPTSHLCTGPAHQLLAARMVYWRVLAKQSQVQQLTSATCSGSYSACECTQLESGVGALRSSCFKPIRISCPSAAITCSTHHQPTVFPDPSLHTISQLELTREENYQQLIPRSQATSMEERFT